VQNNNIKKEDMVVVVCVCALLPLQGILKGGSTTVLLTSCLTGLDKSVLQIKKQKQLSYS
jgi:hypothetical protein